MENRGLIITGIVVGIVGALFVVLVFQATVREARQDAHNFLDEISEPSP